MHSYFEKGRKTALIRNNFFTGLNNFTMMHNTCQPSKHSALWSIETLVAYGSYPTSIRGNDFQRGNPRTS